jgi:1,4-dihydroxy-2-naphthoate octaprenyltransferase
VNRWHTYWMATRMPFAFPASVIPALLGGLVAVIHGGVRLNVLDYALTILAAGCVHAGANLLSDFCDYRKGVDRPELEGTSRGMIVSGRMSAREILIEALAFWGLAALFGISFLVTVGPVLLPVLAVGLLLGAGYTASPVELKYRALGDVSVFLAFGVGITLGSYAVQTGRLAWEPVFYGLPVGLLIWAILHANNLRAVETDREVAVTTVAMLLGPAGARALYVTLILLAYGLLIVMAALGWVVPTALLALLSVPLAVKAIRQLFAGRGAGLSLGASGGSSGQRHGGVVNLDMRTAQLQMAFGLLLLIGLAGALLF